MFEQPYLKGQEFLLNWLSQFSMIENLFLWLHNLVHGITGHSRLRKNWLAQYQDNITGMDNWAMVKIGLDFQ